MPATPIPPDPRGHVWQVRADRSRTCLRCKAEQCVMSVLPMRGAAPIYESYVPSLGVCRGRKV